MGERNGFVGSQQQKQDYDVPSSKDEEEERDTPWNIVERRR
ncbi:unnamed protein product [Ectocarpus sp. 13 AM-2016]